MKKLTLSLIFLLICGISAINASLITVSGNVSGTWSADTVMVVGEITVPEYSTLTIMPGVEVLFCYYTKLTVESEAELIAVGTEVESIIFDEYFTGQSWRGIRFMNASDSSRLVYCHITHGTASGTGNEQNGGAVYCSGSSPLIQNCLIDSCNAEGHGGAIACYQADPLISNNTIINNHASGDGGGIFCEYYSDPTISNNTISFNTSDLFGGGIRCYSYSDPIIDNNTITFNWCEDDGGGIRCTNSSPVISNCNISSNTAMGGYGGGGISLQNSNPEIFGDTISFNVIPESWADGGGIYCDQSSPTIWGNTIIYNEAYQCGGGIDITYSSNPIVYDNYISGNLATSQTGGGISCRHESHPTIFGNMISGNDGLIAGGGIICFDNANSTIYSNIITGNTTSGGGGGICFANNSAPYVFEFNEISNNVASDSGGGICIVNCSPYMNKNTIVNNLAVAGNGGGIYCTNNSYPQLVNCILWNNIPDQIMYLFPSNVQATYCDIGQTWIGVGNINADPMFIDPFNSDFHLQEDSPCIDAGDPSSPLDPDSTIADMGSYYYDQGAVSDIAITLTPYSTPIQIPSGGGSFDFNIAVANTGNTTVIIDTWTMVTLPGGTEYGPIINVPDLQLSAGFSINRDRTQNVPASAPMGDYTYDAYVGEYPDIIWDEDHFEFEKLTNIDGYGFVYDWSNTGETFSGESISETQHKSIIRYTISPNPFNPSTTIRFDLPEAGEVSLNVYNIGGQRVAELINSYHQPGYHSIEWNADNLPSGIYFARLYAGEYKSTQKLLLLK